MNLMPDKTYEFLKQLYQKGTLNRMDQNVIKSKWYFDFKVMKLQRAGLVNVSDGMVTLNFRGKVWCKTYFIIEDGNE